MSIERRQGPNFGKRERDAARTLIDLALAEDLGERGDITTQIMIPQSEIGTVHLVARQPGRLSGLPIIEMVFARIDGCVQITHHASDAAQLAAGERVATLTGPTASLLTGERTALNFITHLSGIATLTAQFVDAAASPGTMILDTRKTLPGWRVLQKYAVLCGGGQNHRMGLYDGILIKDNHLAAWQADPSGAAVRRTAGGPLAGAVMHARSAASPDMRIEIEVDSLMQFEDALAAAPDIVLLDNFQPAQMRAAVLLRNRLSPNTLLEASGGVNLQTIAVIAATGVDCISIGALTHSAPALDLAFDWETTSS